MRALPRAAISRLESSASYEKERGAVPSMRVLALS
jgi:hypothetical protein